MNDFLNISIVGVFLSLFIQWLKDRYGTESYGTKLGTILASILLGTVYYYLSSSTYYQSVLGILASASTFYALFLKK